MMGCDNPAANLTGKMAIDAAVSVNHRFESDDVSWIASFNNNPG